MSTQINKSNPSICIPRVFNNISKERVFRIFAHLFGSENISRIDMPSRLNAAGEPLKRVFVHFKQWPPSTHDMRDSLLAGKEVKIVYDDPWYWKLRINTGVKKEAKQPDNLAPRVEIGEAVSNDLPKPKNLLEQAVDVSDRMQPDKKKKKKKKVGFEESMKAQAKEEVADELHRVASCVNDKALATEH